MRNLENNHRRPISKDHKGHTKCSKKVATRYKSKETKITKKTKRPIDLRRNLDRIWDKYKKIVKATKGKLRKIAETVIQHRLMIDRKYLKNILKWSAMYTSDKIWKQKTDHKHRGQRQRNSMQNCISKKH